MTIHRLMAICAVLGLLFQKAEAQENAKLTLPSSPAFSILSYEPTAVMRPATAKELAADVLNSFDENGKLLLNLGLEVMPYWLKSRPQLDRQTYLRPSPAQAFKQSFSLSAATVKDSISGNNRLGAGFRFRLFNGEPVAELDQASARQTENTKVLSIINGVKATLDAGDTRATALATLETSLRNGGVAEGTIAEVKAQAATVSANTGNTPAELERFFTRLIDDRSRAGAALSQQVSDLLYERRGFFLEFAGASAFNTAGSKGLEKVGIWGNASYFVSPTDLFTLTSRYMHQNDNVNDTTMNNFDIGLGFLKKTTSFNVSIEGMIRWYNATLMRRAPGGGINTQKINEFTYRVAVQGSYTIARDISVNLSLGKDFDSPFIAGAGFFSILGFSFNVFEKERPVLTDQ